MQLEAFHESLNDALREIVQALGGFKKIGPLMRPEKTIDEAARWISDCLNPDRREKFDPDQVLFLLREGRHAGVHAGMAYLARACGYADPTPIEPEDEKARLQREYVEAVKVLSRLSQKMESIAC